jgi:uncharacterized protein (TIGR03067 family)
MKAMVTSKIKGVLAAALVALLALGGGVGLRLFGGPAAVARQPGKELARRALAGQGEKRQAPAAGARKDLDRLQGTWRVVGAEEQGNAIHEEAVKEAKETFVVKGGKMTYCRDGKVQVTMEITLAPGQTPKAMDLEFTDGKEKGYKNHAIYQLDGDWLKLRMNDKFGGNSASERPTEFSTAQGKEAVLLLLRREKK